MDECEKGFKSLKEYLVTPSILTRLELGEVLYIYLVTSDKAISLVLVKEERSE